MENNSQDIIKTDLVIPQNARIKVYWDDRPENYSRENRNRVQKYFATKYDIDKTRVNIVYRPIKVSENGDVIEISGAGIENIMDISYQRELFKEWINREGKEVNFDKIVALDDKVNSALELDTDIKLHKKYVLKWLTLNNFLSFGEDNYFPVDRFKALTVVNSVPENQGGKTTLTVDAMKFLFFGKTTKTDKNEEIFNQFNEESELKVRGMLEIDGDQEVIIERVMTRKKKRSGDWNITNSVNYYQIMPDGSEELMNEENATITTQAIKDAVGSEKDFEMVVLATARNLDSLIDLTTTESGKLLTRFIGLEIIEQKEAQAREMYNAFAKTMKSNTYNVPTLTEEIEQHNKNLVELKEAEIKFREELVNEKDKQNKLNEDKIALVEKKDKIDVEILTLNPSKLEKEIETITETGKGYKADVKEYVDKINKIGVIEFDEDRDHQLGKDKVTLSSAIAVTSAEIDRLEKAVADLVAGGICQSCNRKLDDVDNTEHINKHNADIQVLMKKLDADTKKLKAVNVEIESLSKIKEQVNAKNKLELSRDKLLVELDALRLKLKSKNDDLKKYNDNLASIKKNEDIDIDISNISTQIKVCEHQKEELSKSVQKTASDIENNNNQIQVKEKLIETINKESEVEKVFKIYIEMVGKKGISKLVLRSVLPIINSELQRLLDEVTDFDVEIFIDDKNEVKFSLIKDEVEKPLKSGSGFELTSASIALRCVLGKMSTLPMPNFIVFDEVLGRVANSNIEGMKPLFDKIKDMFDIVFFISHNELVKDMADSIITVVKENNISKIKFT